MLSKCPGPRSERRSRDPRLPTQWRQMLSCSRCCSAGWPAVTSVRAAAQRAFECRFSKIYFRWSIFECRTSRIDFRGSIFEGRFLVCRFFGGYAAIASMCVCAFLSCAEKRNCQPTGGARNIRLRKNMLRIEFVADITFSQECSVASLAQALRVRAYAPCGGSARESHLSQLRRARTERSH